MATNEMKPKSPKVRHNSTPEIHWATETEVGACLLMPNAISTVASGPQKVRTEGHGITTHCMQCPGGGDLESRTSEITKGRGDEGSLSEVPQREDIGSPDNP